MKLNDKDKVYVYKTFEEMIAEFERPRTLWEKIVEFFQYDIPFWVKDTFIIFPKNVYRGIRNIIRMMPHNYKTRDWDYWYLFDGWKTKLDQHIKCMEKTTMPFVGMQKVIRDMEIASHMLKVMSEAGERDPSYHFFNNRAEDYKYVVEERDRQYKLAVDILHKKLLKARRWWD